MTGNPRRTINMPPMKQPVAFAFRAWKKNLNVLSIPITNATPAINKIYMDKHVTDKQTTHMCNQRTFPIARRPRSKNNTVPRIRNITPKPERPIPISVKQRVSGNQRLPPKGVPNANFENRWEVSCWLSSAAATREMLLLVPYCSVGTI